MLDCLLGWVGAAPPSGAAHTCLPACLPTFRLPGFRLCQVILIQEQLSKNRIIIDTGGWQGVTWQGVMWQGVAPPGWHDTEWRAGGGAGCPAP